MAEVLLTDSLQLPCGATLPNRIAKSAMTEGLADPMNCATEHHCTLYRRWSEGGCGLLMTGNVQVDRRYLERPGNVAVDDNGGTDELRAFARAGTAAGNHLWMQIAHAGRQVTTYTNPVPVGPSAIGLEVGGGLYPQPRALSEYEIADVIARFTHTATVAKDAGFTGIQLHAAHGYLLSSFLSPKANVRDDDWGGSLENRARLLLESVRACRKAVGNDFPVSVKLNSADFQTDGLTAEESMQVVRWLGDEGLDLLEISGGNYESPAMMGYGVAESTVHREAYFLEYAEAAAKVATMPLMVTGGFRSAKAMHAALQGGGCDVIGLARPLCADPSAPLQLLADADAVLPSWETQIRPRAASISWFYRQLFHLADGEAPELDATGEETATWYAAQEGQTAKSLQNRNMQ